MGRLEEALERLADQDRHLDPARVTDRLERRLRGGDVPTLVRGDAPLPAPPAVPWWRRGPAIAVAGALAALIAVALPVVLLGRGEPGGPATTGEPSTTAPPPSTVATTTTPPPETTTTLPPETTTTSPPQTSTTPPTTADTTTTLPVEPFPPLAVTLVFEIDGSSNVAYGTFTASGPAVETGVMCPSGTSYERSFEASGYEEQWITVCSCDDGTGWFSLDVATIGEWEGGVGGSTWLFTGTWTLIEGAGAYSAMAGEGANEGICPGPDSNCIDTYTGTVWRDDDPEAP